jgi:hypothetical protein
MVKFRCKRSGNCVSFSDPNDIEGTRKHEGYEEVKDEANEKAVETIQIESQAPPVLKKRGRPARVVGEL